MPPQIEKLEAYASHLLDAFIRLRERYALLEPMLFNPAVVKVHRSSIQTRGFKILRHSLFLSCAQDIANICRDSDCRTPSIHNIVAALEDVRLCKKFEERYAAWVVPSAETETDPDIVAALRRMEDREHIERRAQFLELYEELTKSWIALKEFPALDGFCAVRDKVSAHTEVRYIADKYQLIDISVLGIKWGDLKVIIEMMQRLVELIGLIVRNTCFAWDILEQQLTSAGADFWSVSRAVANTSVNRETDTLTAI